MCDTAAITYTHMLKNYPCMYHRVSLQSLKDATASSKAKFSSKIKGVFFKFFRMTSKADPNDVDFKTCIVASMVMMERLLKRGVYIHSNTADR